MKTDLIDLTRQCCDADGYLALGYRCAQTNFCYDELRPIGDALWFSLPFRLGLGEECLFYMQGLLVLLVAYSLFILFRKSWLPWALAMAVLLLQLWPTFFNSLADTPASLLLIEGLLLALIATERRHAGLFFAAGIFLGCSALLRAAYFHPLCAAGLIFFIFWLWQTLVKKQNHLRHAILILSFTLPMALQFFAAWKNMHEWSFVSRDQTQAQFSDHLNSAVVGYDTLLIESSYYWAPPCLPSRGVLTGIKDGDAAGLYCLLSNRIYFYFGSYAPHTFHGSDNKNFVSNGFAEEVGNISAWSLYNITAKQRDTRSPAGDMKASRLTPQKIPGNNISYVQSSSLLPLGSGNYRYSMWLWLPAGQPTSSVHIEFFRKTLSPQTLGWNYQQLNEQSVELTEQPKQFFFELNHAVAGYLVTRLTPAAEFIAWGAMLETADTSTGYIKSAQRLYSPIGSESKTSGHERIFSTILLTVNLAVILISSASLLLLYKKTSAPVYLFVAAMLGLILIEALLILPEQRFIQASLAMHWFLFFLFMLGLVANNKKTAGAPK